MKKTILTFLLLTFLVNFSFSQDANYSSRTTEEEYNYMSKGYQVQIANGLDMKKGYNTGIPILIIIDHYNYKYIPLFRISNREKVLVGYIVNITFKNAFITIDYWCCLPLGNKELLERTYNTLSRYSEQVKFNFFKSYLEFNLIPKVAF